jgi:hypothetical protein
MKETGPVPGGVSVSAAVDTKGSTSTALPVIEIVAFTQTKDRAIERASRQARAFTAYIGSQQKANKIPVSRRIGLTVIKGPTDPAVVIPRKKTLPILVFLSILVMVAALIASLENIATGRARREPSRLTEDGGIDKDLAIPIRASDSQTSRSRDDRQPKTLPDANQPGRTSDDPGESRPAETGKWGLRQSGRQGQ